MTYPYAYPLILQKNSICQTIHCTLSSSKKMAHQKKKLLTITNIIHTNTYVHLSRVSKVGVEVGLSAILLLSITMQKRIDPKLTGQLKTTSKQVTILLIFISFKNIRSSKSTLENLVVQRVAERCKKLHNLHLTYVSPLI